jgi:mRNA-degrading endonuclease toxin of MazEF toxin-antitoxin module
MSPFPREFPRRGEIYWAQIEKVRPVLIVSAEPGNKFSNAVVVAALTSQIPEKQYPMNVLLPAGAPLPDAGVVLCRNLYTFLKEDLQNYRADLSADQLGEVDQALISALELPKPPA